MPKSLNVVSCSVSAFIRIPPSGTMAHNVDSSLQGTPLIEGNHGWPVRDQCQALKGESG